MFICSVKAKTLRLFGLIALCLCVISAVGIVIADASAATASAAGISLENIKTEKDRRAFLEAAGVKATEDAESAAEITLPKSLDAVLLGYNEIQKQQGLDLSRYAGKTVTRYTYRIADQNGAPTYANLILYRNTVVGADLTQAGSDGFVKPLLLATEGQ